MTRLEPQVCFLFFVVLYYFNDYLGQTVEMTVAAGEVNGPQVDILLIILMCYQWFIAILYLALIPQVIVHVDIVKMT